MSNYRGLIWSLVAIAGTATAATMAYRYVTRNVRDGGDEDDVSSDNGPTAGRRSSRRSRRRTAGHETLTRTQFVGDDDDDDAAYESLSEGDYDDAFNTYDEYEDDSAMDMVPQQQEQQQMMLVAREGNLLLSVFGVVLMLVVGAVSLIMTWTSDDVVSPADLPMFAPLMWIAIGIFTAASVEVLSHSALTAPEIPVLTEKAVFPSDDSDFELIRQHNGDSLAAPQNPQATPKDNNRSLADLNGAVAGSSFGQAQLSSELSAILKRADELSEQNQQWEAREYLLLVLPEYSDEVEVLWRLARASYTLSEESTDREEKKAFAFEGLTFAEKAYACNANSAASNLWMAILTSAVGNFRDLKEKIAGAYVIRDHTQRAIELNPSDATAYHILANWSLAFADMTWIEKKAAAALFGTPPTATYDDVIKNLHAAENLSPGTWKKNSYLLAETYYKMNELSEAAKWALVAKDVPIKTKEDESAQQLVLALMKKLKL
uniref:Regulator of microtubule dynamics protein 1 n=1 Tax=Globisporangium ultimum (strain ATCC 200006 / CBS 805.95 / DAOM BR144) TaxID=431595 RepID=K3X622_GLOUD